jgi:predicted permease
VRWLARDLSFAARTLRKTPAATLAVVATLGVTIAASGVAFALLDGFFIRRLPVREPQRLVRIYTDYARGPHHHTVSYSDFADIRELRGVFAGVLAEEPVPLSIGVGDAYQRLWGERVSAGYLSLLGVRPALGRSFSAAEHAAGGAPVALLGHAFWKRRLGGSRDVLGRRLTVDGRPCTVVGVLPDGFRGTTLGLVPDLWVPLASPAQGRADRGARASFVVGRLRPGVDLARAREALDLLASRLARSDPDTNLGVRFAVLPESAGRVHPLVRGGLLAFSTLLLAVAGLVLVLACCNIAAVLLARGLVRRREIAIRRALGARRRTIVRQLLVESALLAACGGLVGTFLAWALARLLSSLPLPRARGAALAFELGVDWRVVGFALVVTASAALLFGTLPALAASRLDVVTAMNDERATGGRWRTPLGSGLVAAQVVLSLVLLVGGGLFLQSLLHARRIDLGFDPRGVVVTDVDLPPAARGPGDARRFWEHLRDGVASLPAVASVTLADRVPFEIDITTMALAPEGYAPPGGSGWPIVDWARVDRGYFQTLGIPLLAGRDFAPRDDDRAPRVAVVDDTFARRFWPSRAALGRRFQARDGTRYEVIGVARPSKHLTLGEAPKPFVYLPASQGWAPTMTVIARGRGDLAALLGAVQGVVRAQDPAAPVYAGGTLGGRLGLAFLPAVAGAVVLNGMAVLALALTALGLYGTVAQGVGGRQREIGIRRALGASDGQVVRLVLAGAAGVVVAAAAVGTALGWVGAHLVRGLLYEVRGADLWVLVLAPVALALVALAATWAPVRRALRTEPVTALRLE